MLLAMVNLRHVKDPDSDQGQILMSTCLPAPALQGFLGLLSSSYGGPTASMPVQELRPRPETAESPGPGAYDVSRLRTPKAVKAPRRSCPGTPKALCTFGCLER